MLFSLEMGKEAREYIRKIPTSLWASHAFNGYRWGQTTSNIVEIMNGVFAKSGLRQLAPLKMLHDIWEYEQRAFSDRAMENLKLYKHLGGNGRARPLKGMLCPSASRHLAHNIYATRLWDVVPARLDGHHMEVTIRSQTQLVNGRFEEHVAHIALPSRWLDCTCGKPSDDARPCVHVLAMLQYHRKDPREYYGHWYSAETQLFTYQHAYTPIVITGITPESIQPPAKRQAKGRTQTVRKATGSHSSQSRSQQGNHIPGGSRCSYCNVYQAKNHNIQTCPQRKQDGRIELVQGDTESQPPCLEEGLQFQEGIDAEIAEHFGQCCEERALLEEDEARGNKVDEENLAAHEQVTFESDNEGGVLLGITNMKVHAFLPVLHPRSQDAIDQIQASDLTADTGANPLLQQVKANETARQANLQRRERQRAAAAKKRQKQSQDQAISSITVVQSSRSQSVQSKANTGAKRKRGDPSDEVMKEEATKGNVWHRGQGGIWKGWFGPPIPPALP